jgi:hypothetical protein
VLGRPCYTHGPTETVVDAFNQGTDGKNIPPKLAKSPSPNTSYPDGLHWERFATHQKFVERHDQHLTRIREYLLRDRRNGQKLPRSLAAELDSGAAMFLYASNTWSRCNFEEVAVRRFCDVERQLDRAARVGVVALAPKQFTMSTLDAKQFDVDEIKSWTKRVMRGFNYFGCVEAGCYPERIFHYGKKGTVSWHVHFFVWGFDHAGLSDRLAKINREYECYFPNMTTAHFSPVVRERFAPRMRYFLKGSIVQYRESKRREEIVNPKTGEVLPSWFDQWKDDIRPGNAVKMVHVMTGRTLDQLVFAGGKAGRAFLVGFLKEALLPFRRWEAERIGKGLPQIRAIHDQWIQRLPPREWASL